MTPERAQVPAPLAPPSVPFEVHVGTIDGPIRSYIFDAERILIGRASDVDLRVAHSAMARHQFIIERILLDGGPARFRIVLVGGTNPTYLNGQPAVEGSLQPGEEIAVGPLRISVHAPKKRKAAAKASGGVREKIVLIAGILGIGLVCLWMFGGDDPPPQVNPAEVDAPLFHSLPPLSCPTSDACAARAREQYAKGRQYEDLVSGDIGNLYRASIAFAYAAQLRQASNQPMPEIADASGRVDRDARKAQEILEDARFQLRRALAAGDADRTAHSLAVIQQLVPEPSHPIRLGLDKIRRDLSKDKDKDKEAQ
ncbi:MAG TPA: FHA domain-containing protein [Polyangia bacterium]|nr:FHA domain-containing protein [Polyangia bacterium]